MACFLQVIAPWLVSSCHNKDIPNNVNFAFKMTSLTVINIHKDSFMLMTGVMSWLWRCHISLLDTPSNKVLPYWLIASGSFWPNLVDTSGIWAVWVFYVLICIGTRVWVKGDLSWKFWLVQSKQLSANVQLFHRYADGKTCIDCHHNRHGFEDTRFPWYFGLPFAGKDQRVIGNKTVSEKVTQ